jgi:predicted CXXCH cytochrome family protein
MDWRRGSLILITLVLRAHAAGIPGYAGAAACLKCHAKEHRQWTQSRHSKMVQPATTAGVIGDFTRGGMTLRGEPYIVGQRNGAFYITESYLFGKPQEHRVAYTLGNRRIQHYLTTLADGKIVVLPPTWDAVRKEWFHAADIDDPEEAPGVQVQVWNKNCYSCHVSQEQKNFDGAKNQYSTAWVDFGINCERCHGPGSAHVAHYSAATASGTKSNDIIMQTRLDAARNTAVCAQCHSFRDIYADGFTAGDNYYDHFLPVLDYSLPAEADPAYWADGRTRRFSNDAFGLWQSECFLKGGATCLDCHAVPHNTDIDRNPQLRPDANALCTRCHAKIAVSLAAHTHHGERSAGSACVECHMPRTVYSIKAEIRDHSMTVPVPENTIRHKIPNACNVCHRDKDAEWALRMMSDWYSARSRQKLIQRADAFSEAKAGDPQAITKLLAILAETSEGSLVRANAAGYLARFSSDPRVMAARVNALHDADALVRAVAAADWSSQTGDRNAFVPALVGALADPVATVRIRAMVSLVGLGIRQLPGEDGERLERAKRAFYTRAQLNSDDAEQLVALGRFSFLAAEPARAISALEASLKLDPTAQAQYLMAGAYLEQNDYAKAREILQAIPAGDSQYEKAQRLLKVIAQKVH